MYHSISFGKTEADYKNTWEDWFLIPSTRPVFNPPPTKTNYIDIPGSNGILDLSEVLTGYPVYTNRTGSIEFIVDNDHKHWEVAYSDIMNFIHGQRMKAILEDDRGFYYQGRFEVNEWKSDKNWSLITIDYDVYPYKKERFSSLEDWLWDPFNFETGIIRNYKNLLVSGTRTLLIPGTAEAVVPIITVSGTGSIGIDVTFQGTKYHLNNGVNQNPSISIQSATNKEIPLIFTGNGTVSIDYRGGSL